jgi:hypothetical protein
MRISCTECGGSGLRIRVRRLAFFSFKRAVRCKACQGRGGDYVEFRVAPQRHIGVRLPPYGQRTELHAVSGLAVLAGGAAQNPCSSTGSGNMCGSIH